MSVRQMRWWHQWISIATQYRISIYFGWSLVYYEEGYALQQVTRGSKWWCLNIKYARVSFQATLIFLMDHLALVVSQSARNKMTPQNLAVCFGPILMLHSESREKDLDFQEPINVLRYLLEIWPSKSGKVQREFLARLWWTLEYRNVTSCCGIITWS